MFKISQASRVQLCVVLQFILIFFALLTGLLKASRLTTCVPTSIKGPEGEKREPAMFGFILVSISSEISPQIYPDANQKLSTLLHYFGLDMTKIVTYSILFSLTFRKNSRILHIWNILLALQMLLLLFKLCISFTNESTEDHVLNTDMVTWIHIILLLADLLSLYSVHKYKGYMEQLQRALALSRDEILAIPCNKIMPQQAEWHCTTI